MITDRTTRFAAFMLAVLITFAIQGAMLWKFDTVAQQANCVNSGQSQTAVTLETVNIVARKS